MPEPTHTQVSRVPMKRLAAPDEIAQTIAFVAPGNASYITGRRREALSRWGARREKPGNQKMRS